MNISGRAIPGQSGESEPHGAAKWQGRKGLLYLSRILFAVAVFDTSPLPISAQVTNPSLLWTPGGVLFSPGEGQAAVATDEAGGAILSWSSLDTNPGIGIQRINRNGALLWQANGIIESRIIQ